MRQPLCVLVLVLAASTCWGQGTDPLKSPGCVDALDALREQEATLPASSAAPAARTGPAALASLEPYRKRVARECLGKEDAALERTARPPVAVAPVTLPPSAAPSRPPALVPPPPPVALPRSGRSPNATLRLLDERRHPPEPHRAVARRAARGLYRSKRRAQLPIGAPKAVVQGTAPVP
jgi:hypothetical protein